MAVIEPIRRVFRVLEALNRRRATTLSLLEAETGLPRPTLVRLLQTLIELGYASHVSRTAGYRLTDHVLTLAGGVRFTDRLIDAASGPMSRFTRTHGWPLFLATIGAGAMVIRHSTAPESPMAFEPAAFNVQSPLLQGALGRAWMGFALPDELAAALNAAGLRRTAALAADLARIAREGHAFTRPARPQRLHGLAVPILKEGRVLGALSMRFPRSAMSEAQAVRRFAGPLSSTAGAIADAIGPVT